MFLLVGMEDKDVSFSSNGDFCWNVMVFLLVVLVFFWIVMVFLLECNGSGMFM